MTRAATYLVVAALISGLGLAPTSPQSKTDGADIKELIQRYQGERQAVIGSGAATRFPSTLLDLADGLANKGDAFATTGNLTQALEAYQQARWQLPYQGPDFPDHVARVLGNLHLRHASGILTVAFNPGGTRLATADCDGIVKIWDMANGHELVGYRGQQGEVRAAAFNPVGKWIATAGGTKDVHIWDPDNGKELRTLKGPGNSTTALAVSPDGKYVFAAADNRTVRIYDVATGEIKRTVSDFEQSGAVRSLAFSPDGTRFAVGTENGQIRVWLYAEVLKLDGEDYWAQQDAPGSCVTVTFTPNSKFLVRCGPDAVKIYDVPVPGGGGATKLRLIWQPPGDPMNRARLYQYTSAAFSKDGRTMFTGCSDGVIRLHDMITGNAAGTFTGHAGPITALALNVQGTKLASASADHTVRLWDFAFAVQGQEFAGHTGPVWAAEFSPDGQRLVSCGEDSDFAHLEPRHRLRGPELRQTGLGLDDGPVFAKRQGDPCRRWRSLAEVIGRRFGQRVANISRTHRHHYLGRVQHGRHPNCFRRDRQNR